MSEDGSEISKLKERLSMTGSKLADISKKAAEATKTAAVKTAELSKDAAQSACEAERTNDAVKKVVSDSKESNSKTNVKKKSQNARDELSNEPTRSMTFLQWLPFLSLKSRRMGVVNEQQKNQLLLLEEMQRISSRLDTLERRNRTLYAKATDEDSSQNDS